MTKNQEQIEWKTPWLFDGVDAAGVWQELERVRADEGDLRPELVVGWAERNSGSLLNRIIFTKTDAEAAYLWRVDQARKVILNLRVREDPTTTARVYVGLREGPTRYVRVNEVTEQDQARMVLMNALRDLRAWLNRYRELRSRMPAAFDGLASIISTLERLIDDEAA